MLIPCKITVYFLIYIYILYSYLYIYVPFTANNRNQPISIVYVPSHLYHMQFELFKVSCSPSHILP